MTDNELLLAISDMMDKKLKSELQVELQPLRDEIRDIKVDITGVKDEISKVKDDIVGVKDEIKDIKADITGVKDEISKVKDDITGVKDEISKVKDDITGIKLHLENVTDKNIQLLSENYVPAAKRYERETAKIEAMQADIDVMKNVIREHSEKLQKIS